MSDLGSRHTTRRSIGPAGTVARTVVGAFLLFFAVPRAEWQELVVGLGVAPALVICILAARGRSAPSLRMHGSSGHLINCFTGAVFFVVLPIPAMIFYGSSMLVAAARGFAGCELFAIANVVNGRDDEIGCPVFLPIDAAEGKRSGRF